MAVWTNFNVCDFTSDYTPFKSPLRHLIFSLNLLKIYTFFLDSTIEHTYINEKYFFICICLQEQSLIWTCLCMVQMISSSEQELILKKNKNE